MAKPQSGRKPEQMSLFQVELESADRNDGSILNGLDPGLVKELDKLKAAIAAGERRITANALQIGRMLLKAKVALSPAAFACFVECELRLPRRTAQLYMADAELVADYPAFTRLTVQTLHLLGRAPAGVRTAAMLRLKSGEPLATDDVRRMWKAARPKPRREKMDDGPETRFRFLSVKPDHKEAVERGNLVVGAFRGDLSDDPSEWWMLALYQVDADGRISAPGVFITREFCFPSLAEAKDAAPEWAEELRAMPQEEFDQFLRAMSRRNPHHH